MTQQLGNDHPQSDNAAPPDNEPVRRVKIRLDNNRLNFIIAFSALLISAASFYATYLQADAAKKQVKAMTLPLIQFQTGNYDEEKKAKAIDLTLHNAGVGPALVKRIDFKYRQNTYNNWRKFIEACCETEFQAYISNAAKLKDQSYVHYSNPIKNQIIASQGSITFFHMGQTKNDEPIWTVLDKARNEVEVSICYCSLLEECFVNQDNSQYHQVKQCTEESIQ